jgi:glutamate-5-semialdehyde dehydrogenase
MSTEVLAASDVLAIVEAARKASRKLAVASSSTKNHALTRMAAALESHAAEILAANAEDVKAAEVLAARGELSGALFQRLKLNDDKFRAMIQGVLAVRELPDPAGRVLDRKLLDDGLILQKISCPLGVLAIIFEARPDAITQISSLAIKSGNAVILKGGKEVERTMMALLSAIRGALGEVAGIPEDAVSGVYGREAVQTILGMTGSIDLVIPRGSNALVQYIQKNTQIPVLGHADGVCHIFVDAAADQAMAVSVIVDSKVQYPAVCNAVETILVHSAIATEFLPELHRALTENGVRVRGSARAQASLPEAVIDLVKDDEWHTEYSDLVLAVDVVADLDAAIDHIEKHGSHHTEAIVTADPEAARRFLNEVDSAGVFHNCSTRFADGFRYGFGAEVGVSTSKLHARGPVGLEGLVTYKYQIEGSGQVVRDYVGRDARTFRHEPLDF